MAPALWARAAVQTVLGGSILLLNFWPQISRVPLIMQMLECLVRLMLYIVPSVVILIALMIVEFL
ncbi:MAG: hypothetical protein J6P72_03495 [Firmicutes bacterium]|nr:hypothetical protein [Bacillota bacterium]